jgi:type VI secretion system secreted protein VgrG
MAPEKKADFALQLEGVASADFQLLKVDVRESMSQPYSAQVELALKSESPLDMKKLLGRPASLRFPLPDDTERFFDGVVTEVTFLSVERKNVHYRVAFGPKLELCRLRVGSRIFQKQSAVDIIEKVLGKGNVKYKLSLQSSYDAREFCVQYKESDAAFFQRMVEEEGLFYFFRHTDGGHELVLADSASVYDDLGSVPFDFETQRVAKKEYVFEWHATESVGPSKVTLRDFDFTHPSMDLSVEKAGEAPEWEVYDFPGDYLTEKEGKGRAEVRLSQLRTLRKVYSGKSTRADMAVGAKFRLEGHPGGDGEWAVLKLRHSWAWEGGKEYRNSFLAIPADVVCRMPRTVKRPVIAGPQTAKVVGVSGEEIYPEAHGQVKVQFHWDREGKNSESSSCWVRVLQRWAGAGFGAQLIPRMGQEVVVRFMEGNPDRPVVVGAVYNGEQPPAVALPDNKTQSTHRTSSSLGGGGYNEFRFEDAAGAEEVFLHGQRNETIEVLSDKSQSVGQNDSLSVAKDRARSVGGNQTLQVMKDDLSSVAQNQSLTVAGNRTTDVGANHSESVGGAQNSSVTGTHTQNIALASTVEVGAAAALNVGAAYSTNVALAYNLAVGGLKSSQVAGASIELVGVDRTEEVAGAKSAKVGGDDSKQVGGAMATSVAKDASKDVVGKEGIQVKEFMAGAAKSVKLTADKITFTVGGKLVLSMDKGGIQWNGDNISFQSNDSRFRGRNIKKEKGGTGPSASGSNAIPAVNDPKLKNLVSDLYKGAHSKNPVGSGSTADAVRNELVSGKPTHGVFHSEKAKQYVSALEKWLAKNPNATSSDRAVAENLKRDLVDALQGK